MFGAAGVVTDDLIDRIYEAAFVPSHWPAILDEIGARSGSASGALQIIRGGGPPLWTATDLIRDTLHHFIESGLWRNCERPAGLAALDHAGFVGAADYMTPAQLERDPVVPLLGSLGLGWQVATLIVMPTGENVGLTFERRLDAGRHAPGEVAMLDALRPHLARAALIAARLDLERARSTVSTLEALGLPAAVLRAGGRVMAANELLEGSPAFLSGGHGRLILSHQPADKLLRDLMEPGSASATCSIPIPGSVERSPAIVHVLPLRGAAHDIFGGTTLVLLTDVSMAANVPDMTLLRGLFDLTPKEARLAALLASGRSLKEAAGQQAIQVSTARSYLEEVLRKTGTHQQSQLVALLKSARPLPVA